ncbi:MAG TPA: recombination mediator RecR [Candidatus Saccharimonadales bacterium]|nr:recombination mediator RecR [Candidatus Saccharimonadales bacterium]
MQNVLPPALEELIDALGSLPGVGPRTAERYAYYVLRSDEQTAKRLADALNQLHSGVGYCQKTFALVPYGEKLSKLYTDSSRDKTLVAVVADSLDILPIENTNEFKGTYHVLGGLISPIDDIGPSQLHIQALISRIKTDKVKEVILATNASVEGESTALYIQQQLKGQKVKLTRLARGLPIGVDLEYADQITLSRALEGRQLL